MKPFIKFFLFVLFTLPWNLLQATEPKKTFDICRLLMQNSSLPIESHHLLPVKIAALPFQGFVQSITRDEFIALYELVQKDIAQVADQILSQRQDSIQGFDLTPTLRLKLRQGFTELPAQSSRQSWIAIEVHGQVSGQKVIENIEMNSLESMSLPSRVNELLYALMGYALLQPNLTHTPLETWAFGVPSHRTLNIVYEHRLGTEGAWRVIEYSETLGTDVMQIKTLDVHRLASLLSARKK